MEADSYFTTQEVFIWLNVVNAKEAGRSPAFSVMDPVSTDQAKATVRIAEVLEPRHARSAGVVGKLMMTRV